MPFTDMLKPITDRIEATDISLKEFYSVWKTNTQALIKTLEEVVQRQKYQRYYNYFMIIWPVVVSLIFYWIFR